MSEFWSVWIIVLTVGNILACLWLVRWTMRSRAGEAAQGDVTGHTWDGTLQEYNNPLPRWWLWLFYITLVFAGVYLALYPGLGKFQGFLGWSSGNTLAAGDGSQYKGEMQKAAEKYDPIYKQYAAVAVTDLAAKPEYQEARAMGKRLFLTYCMQCHGSDAGGSRGFPNLTDGDWLWGGAPEQIAASIANGRTGVMPTHAHLGDAKIDEVSTYIMSLSGRNVDAAKAEAGKQVFLSAGCIGCHGMDATGNQMLGAPNLTDGTWLYGGSAGAIKQTITKGRNGVMPAHKDLLGDEKVHLLAAYVVSLSQK
ncbi:MAG: cytochrome-c oxidase, cbb3-type subunit III [Gammaproteobacteria bacterium]|nr:cytochrome-c oxidase, cbb3-type subunit III [Gammaproteobacteria bacterium]MCB1925774.1 cytochrome-c oxidase, cbb3-type subunit III [Gammaproteobacteria bacterium]